LDNGNEKLVLIKEVQNDFMLLKTSHIDFLEVKKDQKITAFVPIHAGHEAPAGISVGGILEQNLHEIEVECLPDQLPENVVVDVAKLNIGDFLHVADIVLPDGVKAVSHSDVVVFTVIDPNAGADEEETAAEDKAAEPEIVGAKEKAEKAAAAEANAKK